MPLDATPATAGPLTAASMAHLKATFPARNTFPSAPHWAAIEAVARVQEAMANGTAQPVVYLSSMDCGVGKSSTVQAFARSLITSEDLKHRSVGMLVCVSRKREAEAMARELSDLQAQGHVVVLTSDTKAELDAATINRAQVLITTQQRIDQALEEDRTQWRGRRPFADLDQFHYHSQPRAVRVHDEAFLPGVTITLSEDAFGPLLPAARVLNDDFRNALKALLDTVESAPHGELIPIPDWSVFPGVSVYSLLQQLAEESRPQGAFRGTEDGVRADLQSVVKALFFLAGRSARVHKSNKGNSALQYRDTLPDDMKPLLVLDASGRVRQTYRDQIKHRDMVELPAAVKDYSPLTIHWWKRGGGKASMKAGGTELAAGVAKAIAQRPDEDWLVVAHKVARGVPDVAKLIAEQLPDGMSGTVHYVTWGNHMATSEYDHVPNVVLCGTLFMAPAYYSALTSLCQDRPITRGLASGEDIKLTTWGETADGVFQAICRGRVRKSDGAKCMPMNAYVIATEHSGMGTILPECFPGATVIEWAPSGPVQSKAQMALDYVVSALVDSDAEWVPFGDIKAHVGVRDKNNFRKLILRNNVWKDGLSGHALDISKCGRESGVCRLFAPQ